MTDNVIDFPAPEKPAPPYTETARQAQAFSDRHARDFQALEKIYNRSLIRDAMAFDWGFNSAEMRKFSKRFAGNQAALARVFNTNTVREFSEFAARNHTAMAPIINSFNQINRVAMTRFPNPTS